MECGKTGSCRALAGGVYRTLYELVVEGPARLAATAVHQFMASDPSVVCKGCYSALSKYGAIKETLSRISSRISSRIATALPSEMNSTKVQNPRRNSYAGTGYTMHCLTLNSKCQGP